MTPDKINTMIPEIHEMKKQRGEWEGLPPSKITNIKDALGGKITETTHVTMDEVVPGLISKRNAYLASKLDEITIDAAKAMEAKREGKRVEHDYGFIGIDTLEANIASVAVKTMDLMGFYGVEYKYNGICEGKDILSMLRIILSEVNGVRYEKPILLRAILTACIHIAELEQIDLEWHINARLAWLNK